MDLWFYPQKYEKFSKKRLSRLLIRCRPAVPLRIAGHPRFRPCAGSPSRSAVSPRRAGPPRCRAERVPGRSGNGPAIVRYGRGGRSGGGTSVSRGFVGFSADRGGVRNPPENLFFGPVLFFFAEKPYLRGAESSFAGCCSEFNMRCSCCSSCWREVSTVRRRREAHAGYSPE